MFKKDKKEINNRIELIETHLKTYLDFHTDGIRDLKYRIQTLIDENKKLSEEVQALKAITQGNLGEASNCELLVLKSYRNAPVIYKDGKLLSSDNMEEANVFYSKGEPVRVEIES